MPHSNDPKVVVLCELERIAVQLSAFLRREDAPRVTLDLFDVCVAVLAIGAIRRSDEAEPPNVGRIVIRAVLLEYVIGRVLPQRFLAMSISCDAQTWD